MKENVFAHMARTLLNPNVYRIDIGIKLPKDPVFYQMRDGRMVNSPRRPERCVPNLMSLAARAYKLFYDRQSLTWEKCTHLSNYAFRGVGAHRALEMPGFQQLSYGSQAGPERQMIFEQVTQAYLQMVKEANAVAPAGHQVFVVPTGLEVAPDITSLRNGVAVDLSKSVFLMLDTLGKKSV